MSFHSWLQILRSALSPRRGQHGHARRGSKRAPTHRRSFEVLEDRSVPAFLAPVDYSVGAGAQNVKAGDFNGDGIPDLVTANFGNGYSFDPSLSVLLGNPDGTFQTARNTIIGTLPQSLVVGDFNEDGKLDIAMANYYSPAVFVGGSVTILLGRGDGTFAYASSPEAPAGLESIATGDLNGDGKLDLVTTSVDYYGNGYLSALIGHGDGTFTALADQLSVSSHSVELADFDGDSKLDLAVAAQVLRGNGDGTFQAPGSLLTAATHVTVADFDADGKLDLAASYIYSTAGTLKVLRGNGDGTFQPAQSFAAGGDSPRSVKAADVSGDGVLDLVMTTFEGLTALLGNGDGTFGLPIMTAITAAPTSLVVADFNADGGPDAAVANFNWSKVSVLLNDGRWSLDDPPSVSIRDATVTEGNTGTASATFTVTLSNPANSDVTVYYDTADITAVAGSDYTAATGTVIIPAGQTSATFTVAVTGDRLPEPTETFAVNVTAATGATIGDGHGIGTILDNEPRISVSDVTKAEGRRNKNTQFTFTITLSVPYDQPVTVSFQTVNGTATTSDSDYVARSGTLTFLPGETTKTITIEVKGDNKKEANEVFYLDLFGLSSNALFTKNRGLGTILNDD